MTMSEIDMSTIKELSFEQSMQELEGIVRRLEEGNVNLEDAIALYERGDALRKQCEDKIKHAQMRVEKIVEKNGEITTTTMDT
jgi:exodeoxyribonuclease VII small subunit